MPLWPHLRNVRRVPSRRELFTLTLLDGTSPAIDPTYFPNTQAMELHWTAQSVGWATGAAWVGNFFDGADRAFVKYTQMGVRLVRGTQF